MNGPLRIRLVELMHCGRYRARNGMRGQGQTNGSCPFEHMLNTTDKGYSVIITMPNKMSLVSDLIAS